MALKVAVVGARGIGTTHANCHQKDELADLVAVCDVVHERADKLAGDLKVPAYYSLEAMLDAHPESRLSTSGRRRNGLLRADDANAGGKQACWSRSRSRTIRRRRDMVAFAAGRISSAAASATTSPARECRGADPREKKTALFCLHRMGFPGGEYTTAARLGAPCASPTPRRPSSPLQHHAPLLRRHHHVQTFMDRRTPARHGDLMVSRNSITCASPTARRIYSQRGDGTVGIGGWWV